VPHIFGDGLQKAIGFGLVSGIVAGAIGIGYVKFITHYGFFAETLSKVGAEDVREEWSPLCKSRIHFRIIRTI
jgi:hypothetical protein